MHSLPMTRILEPWEEAVGTLLSIVKDEPSLKLDFGKFQIRLRSTESDYLKDQLNDGMIGKRISLLKTDIPAKPILMRRL